MQTFHLGQPIIPIKGRHVRPTSARRRRRDRRCQRIDHHDIRGTEIIAKGRIEYRIDPATAQIKKITRTTTGGTSAELSSSVETRGI